MPSHHLSTRIFEVFLRAPFWQGLIAYLMVNALTLYAMQRLRDRVGTYAIPTWYLEHIALPLGRALAMGAFLLLSYPVIYGIDAAMAPLPAVLAVAADWPNQLLNVLFFATVLLSLAPGLGTSPALMLPAQGMAGTALLAAWNCSASGCAAVHYWPGATYALLILLAALGVYRAEAALTRWLTVERDDVATRASALLWRLVSASLLVLPVLLYSLFLGRQFAS